MLRLLALAVLLSGTCAGSIYRDAPPGSFVGTATADLDMGGLYDLVDLLALDFSPQTIAADDVTPDVSGGSYFVTSANTGATAITDLDSPRVGQFVMLCGGSDTNSSTIADSGNFNLNGAMTLSLDACIILFAQADNDYVELARSNPAGGLQSTDIDTSAEVDAIGTDWKAVRFASITFSATGAGADCAIVGTGTGSLGDNTGAGCLVVAAPGANKRIVFLGGTLRTTYDTAAYTGTEQLQLIYGDQTTALQSGSGSGFTVAANRTYVFAPASGLHGATAQPDNKALRIWDNGGLGQPGTAAGTGTLIVWYIVEDAP